MSFYVYMLKSVGKKIVTYVGYTKNLKERIKLHNSGKGAKFTRGRKWKLIYKEKCKTEAFQKLLKESIIPINNKCITDFMAGDFKELQSSFFKLSEFQFEYFKEMIPPLFREIWENGLRTNKYSLKLCGAGGGGFLLGLCEDFTVAKKELEEMDLRPIRFNFVTN